MPTQVQKLQAQAEHLLDGFLGLSEKWALLEPMLVEKEIAAAYAGGARARGFLALRRALSLSCAVDIANLCLDTYPETPSLRKIARTLKDESLRI